MSCFLQINRQTDKSGPPQTSWMLQGAFQTGKKLRFDSNDANIALFDFYWEVKAAVRQAADDGIQPFPSASPGSLTQPDTDHTLIHRTTSHLASRHESWAELWHLSAEERMRLCSFKPSHSAAGSSVKAFSKTMAGLHKKKTRFEL